MYNSIYNKRYFIVVEMASKENLHEMVVQQIGFLTPKKLEEDYLVDNMSSIKRQLQVYESSDN